MWSCYVIFMGLFLDVCVFVRFFLGVVGVVVEEMFFIGIWFE